MAAHILATTSKLTQSYVHTPSQRRFCGKTIGQLFELTSDAYPQREAITYYSKDGDVKRLSFEELKIQVDRFAKGLTSLGLQKGEKLGILVGRRYEYIVIYLGAMKAGLIAVRLRTSSKADQLRHQINKVGCGILVIDSNFLDTMPEVLLEVEASSVPCHLQRLPSVRLLINIDSAEKQGACLSPSSVVCMSPDHVQREVIEVELQQDEPCVIFFTSGSTGMPKAIVHSHHALTESYITLSESKTACNGDQPGCHLCSVPCYSIVFEYILAPMIVAGDRFVLIESTDIDTFLTVIKHERCTSASFSNLLAFGNTYLQGKVVDFSSLKEVSIGGNTFPPDSLTKLRKFNIPNITIGYGMTETCGVICHFTGDPIGEKTWIVGRPLPHSEVKIVCDNFRTVSVNVEGEICVRSPYVFKYYLGEEDRTKAVKTESGWFKTGDAGIMLDDGRIRVLGRKDDCIIKNTTNVYPSEIERYLVGHHKVKLCQAVSVPDPNVINEICLCLVLKPGTECSEEEILDVLSEHLDDFHIPEYILFFESFPVTDTGKIKRNELKRMAAERLNVKI
ncbi:medium-chain acyl-CoA ligase ACSF2, mitochondrial-like [Ptychodera flava]|uniref:medium-chain acyl-CoA ligase ACSF2, mitochondrial-like n=1 Tax=Ptychodera flava TaxID=63121 RepID=UPI00396A7C66